MKVQVKSIEGEIQYLVGENVLMACPDGFQESMKVRLKSFEGEV